MSRENLKAFENLPRIVTVFRGQDRYQRAGLSWTLSRQVAEEFAIGHRGLHNEDPVVLEADVSRVSIASVSQDRQEEEIVTFRVPTHKAVTVYELIKTSKRRRPSLQAVNRVEFPWRASRHAATSTDVDERCQKTAATPQPATA